MPIGFQTKVSAPATPLAGNGAAVAFNPAGTYVAIVYGSSPFVSVYPWDNSTGFGTKVADPGTLPAGASNGVAWSPDGNYIAVAHGTSPFLSVYAWTGSGFGSKVSNPGTLPAGTGSDVSWSPDGNYIAVAVTSTPFVAVYPWSGGAFGTKIADLGTPAGGNGVAWSPDNAYIALFGTVSPYANVYNWSGAFGAKVTDPVSPVSNAFRGAWTPDGGAIAYTSSTSPYVCAYPWSGGAFGTKYSDPGTSIASASNGLAFTPDGNYIAIINNNNSPYIFVFPWSNVTGFGPKVANPASLPPTGRGRVAFGKISPYSLVCSNFTTSPYVSGYIAAPPSNSVAPAVTGTAQVGQTLTTTNGTWTNSPTSYAYLWKHGDDSAAAATATNSTYIPAAGDVGFGMKCVVTATNIGGNGAATSNTTSSVLPAVPTNSVAPSCTPSSGTTADTFTFAPGTWTGSPTSYETSVSVDGGAYTVIDTSAGGTPAKTGTQLGGPGTIATRVRAQNAGGWSGYVAGTTLTVTSPAGVPVSGTPGLRSSLSGMQSKLSGL